MRPHRDLRVCTAFCGGCGKALQLTAQNRRRPESEIMLLAGPYSPRGSQEGPASSSFWWPQASLGSQLYPSNLCLLSHDLSVCMCLCPGLLEGHIIGFGAHQDNSVGSRLKIPNSLYLQRPHFQTRSLSKVPGRPLGDIIQPLWVCTLESQ